VVYRSEPTGSDNTLFGINIAERNYARLREVRI